MSAADQPHTTVITAVGPDSPGVTAALFEAVACQGAEVIDLDQVVVGGRLIWTALVAQRSPECAADVPERLFEAAAAFGLEVEVHSDPGIPDPLLTPTPGARGLRVSVLGNPLRPDALANLARLVTEFGGNIDRIHTVADYPVTAVEWWVSGADEETLRVRLSEASAALGVDLAVRDIADAGRGAHLVVMDVDSTLIRDEVIELLAAQAGCADKVAEITERAMRGELDFAESLRERVALLAGLPESVLEDAYAAARLTPGARTLCRTLQAMGYHVALVSGGFAEVVGRLADDLGIRMMRANQLECADGLLTGRLIGPVIDRAAKAQALKDFASELDIPLARTVAIGDGANDLDMLAMAGLGVAFNAKPIVREAADASVTAPYLDTVLYLMGIGRADVARSQSR